MKPEEASGARLYRLLPEVYRSRDNGDLEQLLGAFGEVLDLVRGSLEQRLADSLPDPPLAGAPAGSPEIQGWVLPYWAELLDVRLVSPDEDGRREEVARAVEWRKEKGTIRGVEKIARALGRFELEGVASQPPSVRVQEGFRRVAVTPSVGQPLLPEDAYGARPMKPPLTGNASPRTIARHAGLPAATIDLRYKSCRVASATAPGGSQQANPHGVPCAPGRSGDVSRSTPDVRAPGWRRLPKSPDQPSAVRPIGEIHPRRVLIFARPFTGFFPPDWEKAGDPAVFDDAHLDVDTAHTLDGGLRSGSSVSVTAGSLELSRSVIVGDLAINAGAKVHHLTDCIIDGTLALGAGKLVLERCAIRTLVVNDGGDPKDPEPVVSADGCLFQDVQGAGLVRLIGVTVLGGTAADRLQVSDSLLVGDVGWSGSGGCFRFSRVPAAILALPGPPATPVAQVYRCTSATPYFLSSAFGEEGGGVLHPRTTARLRGGAEDGGEVGAYHHLGYALREAAVLDKVSDHLPLGQVAFLIPDATLACSPPNVTGE